MVRVGLRFAPVWELLLTGALAALVSSSSTTYELGHEPWKSSRCLFLWGAHHGDTNIAVRELFTIPRDLDPAPTQTGRGRQGQPTRTVSPSLAALMATNTTWPPHERGSVDDFYAAMRNRESELQAFNPGALVAAKIIHSKRILYVKNLKAGSTTLDILLDPHRHKNRRRTKINETELALNCLLDSRGEACTPRWVPLDAIPDQVAAAYFTFSFVRDPFTRVVSSHREFGAEPFTDVVMGRKAKVSQNSHFLSQVSDVRTP